MHSNVSAINETVLIGSKRKSDVVHAVKCPGGEMTKYLNTYILKLEFEVLEIGLCPLCYLPILKYVCDRFALLMFFGQS